LPARAAGHHDGAVTLARGGHDDGVDRRVGESLAIVCVDLFQPQFPARRLPGRLGRLDNRDQRGLGTRPDEKFRA